MTRKVGTGEYNVISLICKLKPQHVLFLCLKPIEFALHKRPGMIKMMTKEKFFGDDT